MKISEEIIARKLHEKYIFKEFGSLSTNLILERPVFFKDEYCILNNKVCIMYNDCIPLESINLKSSLILSIGPLDRDKLSSSNTLLEFTKDTCPFELFNYIQEIFDIYDEWENKLQQILNDNNSIKDMVNCSFNIFNNPMIICTSDFLLISYSSIIDEDPNLEHIANPDKIYENSNILKLDSEFNSHRDTVGAFYYYDHISGLMMLCINLFDHNRFTHRIIVSEEFHSFYPSDKELLEYFSKYIDLMISKISILTPDFNYTLNNIISSILSEDLVNPTFINQRLAEFYWFSNHTYFCINIKIGILDIQNLTVNSICKQIESLIPNSCSLFFNDDIAVFVNLTKFGGDIKDVMSKLVVFLRDSYLKAGVSNSFVGLSELKYNYIQACISLDIGRRYKPYQWIYHFEDVALSYLMECCTKDLPPHIICSQKILLLKNHDKEHDTEYYKTLKVYLENNLNAVKSSKLLFIHRSTFLYRLQKIKELININFDDFQNILYLCISFNILDKSEENKLKTIDYYE